MNNRVTVLILISFGLLVTALITRQGDLAWMALPFLAYLGTGILQSPTAEKIRLRATRSVEKTKIDGSFSIKVRIAVHNQGEAIDHLYFFDAPPVGMHISDGQTEQRTALQAGEEAEFEYTFQAGRGSFTWETTPVVVSDPLGLIQSRLELPAAASVQVLPEPEKFPPLPLRPQSTLHSAGSISARLGGSGTDFWGVREYQPGDSLRRLDWRLTARHPHMFFTKEFEREEIADIGLILDAGRKMDMRVGENRLFEHSIRATASLAEVFLRQGNRVSLLIYGKQIVNLYPGYGKAQLNRILRALAEATTEAEGSFDSLQFMPIHMFSSHSLILVLSPLAPDDWRFFTRMRAFGYQVLLISPNSIHFARPLLPDDHEGRLAAHLTHLEHQLEIHKITQLWIPVIDWQVDEPLAPLVRNALRQFHIQRQR